jgi:hypothetical protein
MTPELIKTFIEASPAFAVTGFAMYVLYKVSMRAIEALEQNTKALARLEKAMNTRALDMFEAALKEDKVK